MLKLMQKKALQLYIEAERGDDLDSNVAGRGRAGYPNPNLVLNGDGGSGGGNLSVTSGESNKDAGNASEWAVGGRGLRKYWRKS